MKESEPRPELSLETTEEAHTRVGSTGTHLSREERVRARQIARTNEAESAKAAQDAPILAQFPENLAFEQQAIAAGTWEPARSFFGQLSASRGNNIMDNVGSQARKAYEALLNLNDASQGERDFQKLLQTELTLAGNGQWKKSDSRIHILHITDKSGDKDYAAKLDNALVSLTKTNSDSINRKLTAVGRIRRKLEN